jgi:predicted transcriptional regulator
MVKEDRDGIALLPIQPPYVEAILEGRKRVEFRRRGFGRPVRHVVVYSTSPVQRIVAFFRVDRIREASPHELWELYWKVGGIDKDMFNAYYQGAQKGFAIEIDEVFSLKTPLPLKSLCQTLSAPQSFSYLPDLLFQQVVAHARASY